MDRAFVRSTSLPLKLPTLSVSLIHSVPSYFLRLSLSTFLPFLPVPALLVLPFIRHSTVHKLFLARTRWHYTPSLVCAVPLSFSSARCLFRQVSVNSPSDFDECNSKISSVGRKLVILGRAARPGIHQACAHTLRGGQPRGYIAARYSYAGLQLSMRPCVRACVRTWRIKRGRADHAGR